MIGGRVIEVAEVPDRPDVLFIDVADRPYSAVETCAIYVERNAQSLQIEVGDAVWWHGRLAMWTPQSNIGYHLHDDAQQGVDFDIKIPRIGYSGVQHPSRCLGAVPEPIPWKDRVNRLGVQGVASIGLAIATLLYVAALCLGFV